MRHPARTSRRAQVFLEFALVLPICLMMFTAMVDLGVYLHRYLSVQTAVREGVRAAASGLPDDQVRAIVLMASDSAMLAPEDVQVVRLENDPALGSLDPGDGSKMSLSEELPRYQSIEIRVLSQHRMMVPVFFPGDALTRIVVSVKTLRPLR